MRQIMKTTNSTKKYMSVNVILSFNTQDKNGDMQEFFDLRIPVSKREANAVVFMHTKFFKRVLKKIQLLKREAGDLIKISTSSNWGLFEEVTGLEALSTQGHSCKWFFGNGRDDLDLWERKLVSEFGFGTTADMSYVSTPENKAFLATCRANGLLN